MTQEIKNPPAVSSSPSPQLTASARQFSLQVFLTLVVRMVMVANSVLAGIIVARWLGAEGVGQLGVINVSVAMVVQLAAFGLPSANTYFIAKNQKQLFATAMNSLLFAMVVGSALAFGLVVLAQRYPEWFNSISPDLVRIAAISIPFQIITLIGLNIFLAVGSVRRFNLLDLAGQTFVLLNAIVALIVLREDLWILVSLNTVVSVVLGVLIIVLIALYGSRLKGAIARPTGKVSEIRKGQPLPPANLERTDRHDSWRPDLWLLGRMLRYGLKFHISILAGALMFRADLLVVNHFRGPAEAGVYSVATQFAMMLMLLPGVIATLLFPRVTAEQDAGGQTTAQVTRYTAFVMFLICFASVPVSLVLPALYGSAFSDATVQLLILLPGVFLIGLESVLVQHFNAIGLPPAIPLFWLLTLAVNLMLVFALVPSFGARGAAVASALSYVLIFALVCVYFLFRTKRRISEILLLNPSEMRRLLVVSNWRIPVGGVGR